MTLPLWIYNGFTAHKRLRHSRGFFVQPFEILGFFWSGWRDLNPRPLRPERSALAKLRYTPADRLEKLKIGEFASEVNATPIYRKSAKAYM